MTVLCVFTFSREEGDRIFPLFADVYPVIMTTKVPTAEDQQSPLRDLLIRISDPDLISLDADLVLQVELLNELSRLAND